MNSKLGKLTEEKLRKTNAQFAMNNIMHLCTKYIKKCNRFNIKQFIETHTELDSYKEVYNFISEQGLPDSRFEDFVIHYTNRRNNTQTLPESERDDETRDRIDMMKKAFSKEGAAGFFEELTESDYEEEDLFEEITEQIGKGLIEIGKNLNADDLEIAKSILGADYDKLGRTEVAHMLAGLYFYQKGNFGESCIYFDILSQHHPKLKSIAGLFIKNSFLFLAEEEKFRKKKSNQKATQENIDNLEGVVGLSYYCREFIDKYHRKGGLIIHEGVDRTEEVMDGIETIGSNLEIILETIENKLK